MRDKDGMMTMNDWDGLSGNHSDGADPVPATTSERKEETGKVVNMPGNSVKNNNKTMYLAMGGLMLFVMGVFGYTKYAQFQNMQNEERMQQQQAFKQKKEEAERKKHEAEVADKEKTNAAAAVTAAAEKNAAEQASPTEAKTDNPDVLELARLKGGNKGATPPAAAAASAQAGTVAANVDAQKNLAPVTPSAQNNVSSPETLKREQYVSMLEGRVNELGLAKLRLEAELCKHEPKRPFCNQSGKSVAVPEAVRQPVLPIARSPQTANGSNGRVMLFESGKTKANDAIEAVRPASLNNRVQEQALPVKGQAGEPAPKMTTLQGLTILRDRVLYRDRDGLTHEVELGGEMDGMGRLEKIDFEKKSFQAGGRTYN